MDESNQAILMLFNNSNLRTRRMAFTPRVSETWERSEKKEKECLPGVGNQVMTLSIKELQSPNIPRLAWVKKHSTDSAGTSLREESPTLKADNTRHVVTVEVHRVPKDKPMKQKEAQLPTLTDEYVQEERKRWKCSFGENGLTAAKPEYFSQRVHFKSHTTKNYWRGGFSLPTNAEHSGKVIEEEYIDPKEKPPNQENKESLSTGTDTTGDLTAEGQAVPSELSSSHKTMESLLTNADKTDELTTEEHANLKVLKLSSQNMVEL